MALTLTSVSPLDVPADGGYRLDIVGTFDLEQRLRAHVGTTGSSADPACYSGIPGQGQNLWPESATLLVAYTPILTFGAPLSLYVVAPDVPEDDTLVDVLTVVMPDYKTNVLSLRARLPPIYKTGPRALDRIPKLGL